MARPILYVGDQLPALPATVSDSFGNVQDLTPFASIFLALRYAYDTTNIFKSAASFSGSKTLGGVLYNLGSSDLTGLTPGVVEAQWIGWTGAGGTGAPQHIDAGQFELRRAF